MTNHAHSPIHMDKGSSITRLIYPLIVCGATATIYLQRDTLSGLDPSTNSFNILSQVTATLVWLSGAWLVNRIIAYLIISATSDKSTGAHAPKILINTVSAAVSILTIFLIIRFVFGEKTGGLFAATSGVATIIIGFAIREMIADFFSGMAISAEQPYRIGDWLEIELGLIGRVVELNWRATRLETQSKKIVVVANSDLASRQFTNLSVPTRAFRDEILITLNYTADPNRIRNILHAAILATGDLYPDGNHDAKIKEFTERGVVYAVRYWLSDFSDLARVRDQVASNVLNHLNQAGISIPYAQADILVTRQRRPRKETRLNARRLLSRIDWLKTMTDAELDELATVAIEEQFYPGDQVVSEGEQGDNLFVVVEGLLEAYRKLHGKDERIGIVGPGQAFGEMSLLTGAPRGATVIAKTQVFAMEIRRMDLEGIFQARPEIADELGRVMAQRTEAAFSSTHDDPVKHDEEFMHKARQIARRISAFFGLPGNQN